MLIRAIQLAVESWNIIQKYCTREMGVAFFNVCENQHKEEMIDL